MRTTQITSRGFTIIELLIVIVIIGVLAVLAFNAFGNIQQNARNSAMVRIAKQYETALLGYKVQHDEYPPFSPGNGGTCVGTGYDDRNGNGVGDCNLFSVDFEADDTFNDALKPFFSNALPPAGNYEIDPGVNGDTWQGMIFAYNPEMTLAGEPAGPYQVAYVLEGNDQDCRRTVVTGAGDYPDYTGTSTQNSGNYGSATACIFLMSD